MSLGGTITSPWAERIEAICSPASALRHSAADASHYPQIEKRTPLFRAPLEDGWVFQCLTIRDHSVKVIGADPGTLVGRLRPGISTPQPRSMIVGRWMQQAAHDPTWLPWLRQARSRVFLVQTLCRLRYSLATGAVASKSRATEWARKSIGEPWGSFIAQSLANHHGSGDISQSEENTTLAFLAFIHDDIQRSAATME